MCYWWTSATEFGYYVLHNMVPKVVGDSLDSREVTSNFWCNLVIFWRPMTSGSSPNATSQTFKFKPSQVRVACNVTPQTSCGVPKKFTSCVSTNVASVPLDRLRKYIANHRLTPFQPSICTYVLGIVNAPATFAAGAP